MHSKIKQLFAISCALVALFFNGHAFYFLFRCQVHAHGLHHPFVDNSAHGRGLPAAVWRPKRSAVTRCLVLHRHEKRSIHLADG